VMSRTRSSWLLQRQQIWVCVVGVLFLADFVFYGYLPSHRRLQSLRQGKLQEERLIQTARSRQQALPELEQSLKATQEAVANFEDNVPAERALGLFLNQIASIMTEHALTDQEVVPGNEIAVDNLNCIPVQMQCKGSLQGVFGFFNDLQRLGRLVRIEKVELKDDGNFLGHITMQTKAVIFYRPHNPRTTGGLADATGQDTVRNDT
jgi:type IV pilus assembly protein PilO